MVQLALRGFRLVTLVLAAYWFLLFVGTHIPRSQMPSVSYSDKLLHFGAFAGLAFLLAWAFSKRESPTLGQRLGALIVAVVYGAADEISQIPVGRSADINDWLADSFGAIFGLIVYVIAKRLWIRWKTGSHSSSTTTLPEVRPRIAVNAMAKSRS